jgi:hypothetical protein
MAMFGPTRSRTAMMVMMASATNLGATRRAVRALRKDGRVGECDAGLVRLAETLAAALDASATDGKAYAVAAVARVHLAVLQALGAAEPPPPPDEFDAFLAAASRPSHGASGWPVP